MNLKEGNELNCVVIENLIENESKISEGIELNANNFLSLSLKNSRIKGLLQKRIDPFFKKISSENNFETNIILGKYKIK